VGTRSTSVSPKAYSKQRRKAVLSCPRRFLFGYYRKLLPSSKLIIILEDTSYIENMKEKLNEIRGAAGVTLATL